MENGIVRVETVPELGGKLVSLAYLPSGKEWLLDSGNRPLRTPEYGSVFTDGDMSGWDECFPTIDECVVDGVRLPDHGGVWPLPWESRVEDDALVQSVDGREMPYRLTRRLSLSGEGTVRLEYSAENIGSRELPFLWTAHPQFQANEPTAILLPDEMRELVCVFGGLKREAGRAYALSEEAIDPQTNGDGMKFYYPDAVPVGWSGLYGRESRNFLILSVNPEEVPYFGVWIDRGMFNDRAAIALEPGIGYYDSLERAVSNGTAAVLKPGESRKWRLEMKLGEGDWRDGVK